MRSFLYCLPLELGGVLVALFGISLKISLWIYIRQLHVQSILGCSRIFTNVFPFLSTCHKIEKEILRNQPNSLFNAALAVLICLLLFSDFFIFFAIQQKRPSFLLPSIFINGSVFLFYVISIFFIPDYRKAEWFLIFSYISGYLFYTLLSLKWKIDDKLKELSNNDSIEDSQSESLTNKGSLNC